MFSIYRSKSHTDGKSLFPFDFCYIPFLSALGKQSLRDINMEKITADDNDDDENEDEDIFAEINDEDLIAIDVESLVAERDSHRSQQVDQQLRLLTYYQFIGWSNRRS